MTANEIPRTFVGHHGDVTGLAFSHNGRELATSGADGSVKVWNLETARELLTLDTGSTQCTSLAFTKNDFDLKMAGYDGQIKVWQSTSATAVAAALKSNP